MAPWEDELTPLNEDVESLKDIIGSEILGVGFHPSQQEGGLTIDYKKNGIKHRVILGYTELGEWISWQGELVDKERTTLRNKLIAFDKKYQELAVDQLKEAEIQSNLKLRSYSFFIDGKEEMSLSVKEIEFLPENVRRLFEVKYTIDAEDKEPKIEHFELQLVVSGWFIKGVSVKE
jgi:hypothetical protein